MLVKLVFVLLVVVAAVFGLPNDHHQRQGKRLARGAQRFGSFSHDRNFGHDHFGHHHSEHGFDHDDHFEDHHHREHGFGHHHGHGNHHDGHRHGGSSESWEDDSHGLFPHRN